MLTIEDILKIYKKNNYVVYEEVDKINILFIRNSRVITNRFDDIVYWFWKNKEDKWELKSAACTTKPGLFYTKNPLSQLGTGVLKIGQYINSHRLGLHKGSYEALVQQKSLPLWRDNDKDEWVDYVKSETGIFGINIHRANPKLESKVVDKYSAACQVFANPFLFNSFIIQCNKHKIKYTNDFTITLVDKKDI